MKVMKADILKLIGDNVVAITTNGTVRSNGLANMGKGNARAVSKVYEWVPAKLGELIKNKGNHVHYLGSNLVSFPVEHSCFSWADISLVMQSARELVKLTEEKGWKEVFLPMPGCGGGGLKREDVLYILGTILDDRFVVVEL